MSGRKGLNENALLGNCDFELETKQNQTKQNHFSAFKLKTYLLTIHIKGRLFQGTVH